MTTTLMEAYEKKEKGLGRALDQANRALGIVHGRTIDTPEGYQEAGEQILAAKDRERLIEDLREETYVPIMREVKQIGAIFKRAKDGWAAVTAELNSQRRQYSDGLERARHRRDKEVRELQEAAARKERAEAEKQAEEAEKRQDKALAAELRSEAARPFIPIPVAPVSPPKTAGLQERKSFKARIVSIVEVPDEYVERKPLMDVLNGLARAAGKKYEGDVDKANQDAPAGVAFYTDIISAARRS